MDVKNIGGNQKEYIKANDGKYYINNCETRNGEIICSNGNTFIKNGYAHKLPDTCKLVDNYVFDRENMKIISIDRYVTEQETREKIAVQNGNVLTKEVLDQQVSYFMKENFKEDDAFLTSLGKVGGFKISKLEDGENLISIETDKGENVKLTYGKHDQITSVSDQNSLIIGDNYLEKSKGIKELSVPNAKFIGDRVLLNSHSLRSLDAKNAGSIGEHSFTATHLRKIDMPCLRNLGHGAFAMGNFCSINAPKLENMGGSNFFAINSQMSFAKTIFDSAKLPDQRALFEENPTQFIEKAMSSYLGIGISSHEDIKALPKEALKVVNFNNLSYMGSGCFYEAFDLQKFNAPKLSPASRKPDFVLCSHEIHSDYKMNFAQGSVFSPKNPDDEKLFESCVKAVSDYQEELIKKDNIDIHTEDAQNTDAFLDQTRTGLSALEAQELLKGRFPGTAQNNDPAQNGGTILAEEDSEGLSE